MSTHANNTPEQKAAITKRFPLRVLLTVTTERLLTERKGDRDNGIGDLYALLGWMTNDSPMTHQLPRFGEECKPWLFKWFPELAPCSVKASLDSLDRWLKSDRTGTGEEAIKMWLTELKMMFPNLKDEYEVQQIQTGDHKRTNPLAELVELLELRESKTGRGAKTEIKSA